MGSKFVALEGVSRSSEQGRAMPIGTKAIWPTSSIDTIKRVECI
jgi:hypothetical protein